MNIRHPISDCRKGDPEGIGQYLCHPCRVLHGALPIPRVSPWAALSAPFRGLGLHLLAGDPQGSNREARGETPGNGMRKRRQP